MKLYSDAIKKSHNILFIIFQRKNRENYHLSINACMSFFFLLPPPCFNFYFTILSWNFPIRITISYFLNSVKNISIEKTTYALFHYGFSFPFLSHRHVPVLFENALFSKSYYSFVVIVDFSRILMTDSLVHKNKNVTYH